MVKPKLPLPNSAFHPSGVGKSSNNKIWRGGPMTQVRGSAARGRLALFCIHCVNRVYGALVVTSSSTWTCTAPNKLSYYHYYYFLTSALPVHRSNHCATVALLYSYLLRRRPIKHTPVRGTSTSGRRRSTARKTFRSLFV